MRVASGETLTALCALVQAPVKPQTPMGTMLSYYLKKEPHLFKATLETQLQRLKDDKDRQQTQADLKVTDSTEVVLYRCAPVLKTAAKLTAPC